MAELKYLPSVTSLALDVDKCIGCGRCTEVCPHAVFAVEDRKAEIVDRDACMECGACALNCPAEAISVGSGVGCATAILKGALGDGTVSCGCSEKSSCC